MCFNQQYVQDPVQVLLNNTIIQAVKDTKFPGIWIDYNLTWEQHVQCLIEKLSRICYALRVLAKISPIELLKAVKFWIYTFNNIIWYNDMGLILKSYTNIKITKKNN